MAWQTPKTDWISNPHNLTSEDLNRIEGNVSFLNADIETKKNLIVSALVGVGVSVTEANTFAEISTAITSAEKTGVSITPTTINQAIPKGIYDTNGGVVIGDADLISSNIKTGVNIFSVEGSAPIPSGNALAADVLSGKTFSNANNTGLIGTIPSKAAQIYTPTITNQTISAGQHLAEAQTVLGSANLAAANIKDGVNIFGVVGNVKAIGNLTENNIASLIISNSANTEIGIGVAKGTVNSLTSAGAYYTTTAFLFAHSAYSGHADARYTFSVTSGIAYIKTKNVYNDIIYIAITPSTPYTTTTRPSEIIIVNPMKVTVRVTLSTKGLSNEQFYKLTLIS